jgi:RNA polymerase sigma-70 factor (ECF subfamily)
MRQVITSAAIQQEVRAGEGDLPALMVRYQGGEAVAIEELVRRLSPALLRFFWFSRRSTMEAEDLLQDCWLRIHRSRHTYRPPEPVLPWIFAIARHTRLDGYRRSRRRSAREVLVAEPPETAPVEAEKGGDDGEAMRELLNRLLPPQREVIVMLKCPA